MKETKYYVFDCDTDLYNLVKEINSIFDKIKNDNPVTINIEYGYADLLIDENLSCNLFPNDEISICFGTNDITFNATGKILKLTVDYEEGLYGKLYSITVEIIDKG